MSFRELNRIAITELSGGKILVQNETCIYNTDKR
jgi:hypothetical protein